MKKLSPKRTLGDLLLRSDGAVSVVVVLLGFLAATIIVIFSGRSPLNFYKSFFQVLTGFYTDRKGVWHWEVRNIGEWWTFSVPFILCGFSFAFAARSGLFNIGAEGQYIAGLTAAQAAAILFPAVNIVHCGAAIVASIAAGAFLGALAGFLKAKFEVSEVVSTIMLNYIAFYLSIIITRALPGVALSYRTPAFPQTASLHASWLDAITNNSLNIGIFITAAAVFCFYFIIEKTNTGYALRAVGFNKDAARSAGIPVMKTVVLAMALSGAFAGLAGGIIALGSFTYGRIIRTMDNYGFYGIAVALVGNNTAPGTAIAGVLFGMLQAAQPSMQVKRIPREIIFIIQGVIVVFIAMREGFRIFLRRAGKR